MKKAEQLGIPVIAEEDLRRMTEGTSAGITEGEATAGMGDRTADGTGLAGDAADDTGKGQLTLF